MVLTYILILFVSSWFTAYALLRLAERMTVLLKQPQPIPAGVFALVAILAFLIVAAAPAPLIVGSLLLAGVGLLAERRNLPPIALWGTPLIAALLAFAATHGPEAGSLPPLATRSAGFLIPLALVLSARWMPNTVKPGSYVLIASVLPLIAAPFLGAPPYIALDSGLIIAALLGMLMAAPAHANLGLARPAYALILGWLMVQALAHGVWIPAVISLLVYVTAIAYVLSHEPKERNYAS